MNVKIPKNSEESLVVNGKICINGINGNQPMSFFFSVKNGDKEIVNMMLEAYKKEPSQLSEDMREALDNLKRSAFVALCCSNTMLVYLIFENLLINATDYSEHGYTIDGYLEKCLEDEDEEEVSIYQYIEIESLKYYWDKYSEMIRNVVASEDAHFNVKEFIEAICVFYNCGYREIEPDLITIESATLEKEGTIKPVSGILTFDD